MLLSGGNYGGLELETLTYTQEGENYNVEGWIYNKEGLFNGMV